MTALPSARAPEPADAVPLQVRARPGSGGEHALQEQLGTAARARAFYDHQVLDHLNDRMCQFVRSMEMVFIATSDRHGEADCSFRAGPAGFVTVLSPRLLAYPEYRGNGVMASLGNLAENGHVGMLFVDFLETTVGLHVNGRAEAVEVAEVGACTDLPHPPVVGALPRSIRVEHFVLVHVDEAYIHCSKHVPLLRRADEDRQWGTDDPARKGGDHFHVKHEDRPWAPMPVDGAGPAPAGTTVGSMPQGR